MEIITNENYNKKGKEGKQEQEEKIQTLEVENEAFENTIRSLVTKERKKKKDVKKKTKEIKKLKDENKHAMQMVDGMKDRCYEKAREKDVEIEKAKTIVAGAEAHTEMVKK